MFLTRMQLNPARRETVRLLGSPQRVHAAVLGAFPPDAARDDETRVLWRLDELARHERNLYIVSPRRPSLEAMQEQYGWSQEPSWQTADYGPFLERLGEDQVWLFRLAANPVRNVRPEGGGRGLVKPHRTVCHQRQWLVDHAERHGFAILDGPDGPQVQVTRRDVESFTKGVALDGRQRPTITRVQYDGLLRIIDAEALRGTLVRGLGRAKAYGCGLMTLAPPP